MPENWILRLIQESFVARLPQPDRSGFRHILDFYDWQQVIRHERLDELSITPMPWGVSYSFDDPSPAQFALLFEGMRYRGIYGYSWKVFLIPPFPDGKAVFSRNLSREEYPHFDETEFDSLEIDFDGADPQVSSLLAFLMRGNFEAINLLSSELLSIAENFMYGKYRNPMNAIIGGYLLIKTGNLDRLHNWTVNLQESFPAIPDGAVIHAWFLLLGKEEKLGAALQSLVEATKRGIPYLSIGARLLYDGLMFCKNHKRIDRHLRTEIEDSLERISPWIGTVDWSSPFTVIEMRYIY